MSIKKQVFSGIKPTGIFTLGNYLGAMKNWVSTQEIYDGFFSIVDLHAITIRMKPAELRELTLQAYAALLSVGLDPDKNILFIQSHVHEHAELAWVLNCYTQFGELSRMTQFKEKSIKSTDNVNNGLFSYPVLMASDILLYDIDIVPVGEDQKQHCELTRNIAIRFNNVYGEVFKIPEPVIPKVGARIMSLQDPLGKMGKSDSDNNGCIHLFDDKDVIIKKFKKAVTDNEAKVYYAPHKAGINNLMGIYSCITGKSNDEIEKEFEGKGYGDFKLVVGESVADALAPIREKQIKLLQDKTYLEQVYKDGAQKASNIAGKKLKEVYEKIGFKTI